MTISYSHFLFFPHTTLTHTPSPMNSPPFPLLSSAGLRLGAATALASAVLDQEEDRLPPSRLHAEAWTAALVNLLLIGPFAMARVARWCGGAKGVASVVREATCLAGLHSLLYGLVHRCMHKVRAMRPMHAFHHRFSSSPLSPVVPSVANAVSPTEFVLAYLLPFAVGAFALRPDPASLSAAVAAVSALNLLVHSPRLRARRRWLPFLVHPRTHLHHHATRSPHYFAPTFASPSLLFPHR